MKQSLLSRVLGILVVSATFVAGGVILSSSPANAQISGGGRPTIRPIAKLYNFELISSNDRTIRYDTRTGFAQEFREIPGGAEWKTIAEQPGKEPTEGTYRMSAAPSKSFLRVEVTTGKTWTLYWVSGAPNFAIGPN